MEQTPRVGPQVLLQKDVSDHPRSSVPQGAVGSRVGGTVFFGLFCMAPQPIIAFCPSVLPPFRLGCGSEQTRRDGQTNTDVNPHCSPSKSKPLLCPSPITHQQQLLTKDFRRQTSTRTDRHRQNATLNTIPFPVVGGDLSLSPLHSTPLHPTPPHTSCSYNDNEDDSDTDNTRADGNALVRRSSVVQARPKLFDVATASVLSSRALYVSGLTSSTYNEDNDDDGVTSVSKGSIGVATRTTR